MEDLAHEQYLNVVIYSKAYKYSVTEEIETYLTVILYTVVAYITLSLVVFIYVLVVTSLVSNTNGYLFYQVIQILVPVYFLLELMQVTLLLFLLYLYAFEQITTFKCCSCARSSTYVI